MLGDFITRGLVMVLGYAYPAFECFKTVEKNKVEIEELRFWCQYWILVAALTVFERIGDIFLSWLPMYGEMKLGLFIYLWYPKTKGTSYVYGTFFRPYMARHEEDIDRKLQELKARLWDIVLNYWQHYMVMGQASFFHILNYMIAQSTGKMGRTEAKNRGDDQEQKKQQQQQQQQQQQSKPKEEDESGVAAAAVATGRATSFKNGGELKHRQLSSDRRAAATATATAVGSESIGESEEAGRGGEEGDSGLLAARNRLRRSKGITS